MDCIARRMETMKLVLNNFNTILSLLSQHFSECCGEKQNSIFLLPRRAPSPTRSGMAAWRSSDTHFIIFHIESRKDYFVIFEHSPRARPRFQSSPRGWFPGTRCPSATTPKYSMIKLKIRLNIFIFKYFFSSSPYSRPRPIVWQTVCPNFDRRTRWRIDWVDFRYLK